MSDRYFTDFAESPFPSTALVEKGKIIDIRDERWAHPALLESGLPWDQSIHADSTVLVNPDLPTEQKVEIGKQAFAALAAMATADNSFCDVTEYSVPGCPEEPETEATVVVYRPKSLTKRKARCMFYCLGGMLAMAEPGAFPIADHCERFNCVAVVVKYRTSLQAPYPAAINDLHAGYQWMLDNAEELGINPKNVVVVGQSSGGHLALAIPFRLKRYGIKPKGVVAAVPQTDDREDDSTGVYGGAWDTLA